MASKLLRRSGVAVGLICDLLDWRADLIIQVGVGQFHQEIEVLTAEWPGVEIIGFEPHPDIVRTISEEYPGTLHQVAIGGPGLPAEVPLNFDPRHKDGSTLHQTDQGYRTVMVPQLTLDTFFADKMPGGRVLLWLDCEGSELAALHGAKQLIKHVQVANVEMTAKPLSDSWCLPGDVHDELANHGFYQQWTHTNRSSLGQYDAIYVRENLFDPQYCSNVYEQRRFLIS